MAYFKLMLAGLAGFIVAVIVCILSTPLLWKLEDVFDVELAGHSGPSDSVIAGFCIVGVVAGIAIRLIVLRQRINRRAQASRTAETTRTPAPPEKL